jgi:hypothetical protein
MFVTSFDDEQPDMEATKSHEMAPSEERKTAARDIGFVNGGLCHIPLQRATGEPRETTPTEQRIAPS